jgi:polysaccharide pyruvyl transferase WcaK-like protein
MPTALVAGAFGQGNLGDDALLRAFVGALPEWHLTVTTHDPAEAAALGCEPVRTSRPEAVGRVAAKADAIVIGGGSIFKTMHPAAGRRPRGLLTNVAALGATSTLRGRPFALVGVGASDLPDWRSRALARFIVRRSDLLVLRDEESTDALLRAGVPGPFRVGADPAWTLLRPPEARPSPDRSVLVVPSTYAVAADGWHGMVRRMADTVQHLIDAGLRVHVQVWQRHTPATPIDDERIVRALEHRFGPSIVVLPTPSSLDDAVRVMSDMATVLSFRFHALIAAAAAGVPTVAVAHEAKLGAIARRLEQRVAAVDFEPAALAKLVLLQLASPAPGPAVVKEQVDLAVEGFRLLRVLLAGGRSEEADSLGALPLTPAPSR